MEYLIAKWLHILSSTLLFGTGIGSAFYLLFTSLTARKSGDPRAVAVVAAKVVQADMLFTATTIVFQPLSGWYMAHLAGMPLTSRWLMWSYALYALATACWLPVVWIQVRMRELARAADTRGATLPAAYWRYLWVWTALGVPALFAFVIVFYLMVAKPA